MRGMVLFLLFCTSCMNWYFVPTSTTSINLEGSWDYPNVVRIDDGPYDASDQHFRLR